MGKPWTIWKSHTKFICTVHLLSSANSYIFTLNYDKQIIYNSPVFYSESPLFSDLCFPESNYSTSKNDDCASFQTMKGIIIYQETYDFYQYWPVYKVSLAGPLHIVQMMISPSFQGLYYIFEFHGVENV